MLNIFVCKGAPEAGCCQRPGRLMPVFTPGKEFWQPGNLEKEHIPALAPLPLVLSQVSLHHFSVGNIQNNHLFQAFRVFGRNPPGDESTPIMTDQIRPIFSGGIDESDNISCQFIQIIVADPSWLVAQIAAALIRGPDPESQVTEKWYLFLPGIREFGKTMEKYHQRTCLRASLNHVQIKTVGPDCSIHTANDLVFMLRIITFEFFDGSSQRLSGFPV